MSVRSPVPPIHTSSLDPALARNVSSGGGKPPPPPKSPLRTTTSSSSHSRASASASAMTRRRSDGKVITLNIPTPLSALDPSTRPAAEEVRTRASIIANANVSARGRNREKGKELPAPPTSPTSPGATLAAMRRQTKELRTRTRHYARPASPLRLQSAEREAKRQREAAAKREEAKRSGTGERPGMVMKRESSLSRIGRRLSLTRRASSPSENITKSLRKGLRKSSSFGAGLSSAAQGLARRQSFTKLARRESAKLKSILKPSQTPSHTSADRDTSGPAAPATESKSESAAGAGAGTEGAPVASKKVGASWHPPRKDLERRQSARKLHAIPKPNPNLGAPAVPNRSKPPISATSSAKRDPKQANSSRQAKAPSKAGVQQGKTTFDIVAPAKTKQAQLHDTQAQGQRQEQQQATTQAGDGRDILAEISQKNLSAAEARRLIRQHNQEYFRSQIWDPELQRDSILYRVANDSDEPSSVSPRQTTTQAAAQPQDEARGQGKGTKRDSSQTLVGSSTPPGKDKDKDTCKHYETSATDVEEWGRNVRLAMAKLEDKITSEAISDPVNFMKARRESAQLRAWIAAQRRTSEARMSAIAMGRVRPESPFEHAFVAELLRENEIQFKHSSNPIAEAEKLFQDYNNKKKNSLLPHYVPFSQYPLLTPLEEIEGEAKPETPSDEKPVRRLSEFNEKKAARRAGREYKSFSTSDQLDQLEMHEARCCGLWKPKAFVDKIS